MLCFLMMYFSYANNDWIWNYGFSYNVSKGMQLYKDFNMVITPLYPFVIGNFMKLIGSNIFSFCILNALVLTLMLLFIYKKKKNIFLPIWIMLLYVMVPSYNMWCLFFFFVLYILEEEKKSDYLIGFILGLIFMTKTSFILLTLASLYYFKQPKKILKRIVGFLIPVCFFVLYFLYQHSFMDFINYVFGSIFDFGTKNLEISFGMIVFIISIIYLLYSSYKTKNIKALYTLFFQIMSYPIFNFSHVYYSFIVLVFYILDTKHIEIPKMVSYIITPLLFMPLVGIGILFITDDFVLGTNRLANKYVIASKMNEANYLKENISDLDNAIFVVHEAYYYKYLLNMNVNKYDLLLNGNNGYDSVNRILDEFNNMSSETKFILNKDYPSGGQLMKEIDSYIRDHYILIGSKGDFVVYKKL